MKRKSFGLMVGFLLIGFNLFAAEGDFVVSGNVGIGMSTPTNRLQVVDNTGNALGNFIQNGAGDLLVLQGGSSEKLRVLNNGNVGIGTGNPQSILEVANAANGGRVSVTDGGGTSRKALFINGPTASTAYGEIRAWDYGASAALPIELQAGGGNVGIGTTSPTYLLTMEANGGGYYNQWTHSWVNGSSGRWKSGIRPITWALDTGLKLNGVAFKWKKRTDIFETKNDGRREYISSSWADDPEGINDIGLVGEDVMKVLPEVVDLDQNDPNFVSGVDYSKIVALLIEAIKEQQKQIEALKAKVGQ